MPGSDIDRFDLLPAAVVVLGDVVGVDHEGLDGIAILDGLGISLPLIVQLGDGLADGHGGLSAGAGDLAFSDQSLDVGRAAGQSLTKTKYNCERQKVHNQKTMHSVDACPQENL